MILKEKLFFIAIILMSFNGFSQVDGRINEIRSLYKDYNDNISQMDSYEIRFNTTGSHPSINIYSDFSGKLLIKTSDEDEFGCSSSEYYYKNDVIQFVFHKSDRLITHWGAETVKFKKMELRFYFDNGRVIKTFKKDFVGVEGKDDNVDLGPIQNVEIDHKTDGDANWLYFRKKTNSLLELYFILNKLDRFE